jgi:hypothetical protein
MEQSASVDKDTEWIPWGEVGRKRGVPRDEGSVTSSYCRLRLLLMQLRLRETIRAVLTHDYPSTLHLVA